MPRRGASRTVVCERRRGSAEARSPTRPAGFSSRRCTVSIPTPRANSAICRTERPFPGSTNPTYWNQCQHQSWYFWPWHRAYLWTFEDIVSAAIVSLGGPADWGLLLERQRHKDFRRDAIPKEFTDQMMRTVANPLFVEARFGQGVPARDAALNRSINFGTFVGTIRLVPPGVGGPSTPFSNSGETAVSSRTIRITSFIRCRRPGGASATG